MLSTSRGGIIVAAVFCRNRVLAEGIIHMWGFCVGWEVEALWERRPLHMA